MPIEIKYSHPNFGPFLFKSRIDIAIIEFLLKHGLSTKKNYTKNLAGHIQHQYLYPQNIQMQFYKKFSPYLSAYRNAHCDFHGLNRNISVEFSASDLWINFMKAGDFNPSHTHGQDISFVIFLDVPNEIHKEAEVYEGRSYKPGAITFHYGEHTKPQWTKSSFGYLPKTGDLFIFPALLQHWVQPFKSDVTRISVSGNLGIDNKDKFPKGFF